MPILRINKLQPTKNCKIRCNIFLLMFIHTATSSSTADEKSAKNVVTSSCIGERVQKMIKWNNLSTKNYFNFQLVMSAAGRCHTMSKAKNFNYFYVIYMHNHFFLRSGQLGGCARISGNCFTKVTKRRKISTNQSWSIVQFVRIWTCSITFFQRTGKLSCTFLRFLTSNSDIKFF